MRLRSGGILALVVMGAALVSDAQKISIAHQSTETRMFSIHATAFAEGETIPKECTCEGGDHSPELVWSGAPESTKSFVLICDDPDAPGGVWTHWVAYDIPASAAGISKGNASPKLNFKSGLESSGARGYHGPCPPRGHGAHRYFFHLFALNVVTLNLAAGEEREAVDVAMRDHIVGGAKCMGRYERK